MSPGPATAARDVRLKRVLMYVFAGACLLWAFHDVHPRQLLATMTIANWWFVALAIAVDILTYVLQGVRWKLLLSPIGKMDSVRTTQAIYAGLFTNEVAPLRLGEVVRAFLVSRWLGSGISSVLPSIVVERFLDALWLVLGIGLTAMFVPLPRHLVKAGDVLGAVVIAATLIFVWIVAKREKQQEFGGIPHERLCSCRITTSLSTFVSRFAHAVRQIGFSYRLVAAVSFSGGMLACQALAVWFMMLACGIRLPLSAGAVVFLVVRLGTAIPNAPANVGTFQFFTVVALGLFGVDKTVAAAFSIVDFAALTAPLWIIGLFAVARTGMSLSTIRSEVTSLRTRAAV